MPLLETRDTYKPFEYPWAYDAWLTQQRIHWLPEEVPMADDVKDWKTKLTENEKALLTQIFRFFTQADIDVGGAYVDIYGPMFKPPEIRMMISSIASMESIHIAAYSNLIDTLGMPETEYQAFLEYEEMSDKHDYLTSFNADNPYELALGLAAFSAFGEGLQLFASFAILLNFQRFGKMKGMGQIVAWSVRDESLHCENMIKVFRTLLEENPNLKGETLRNDIYEICKEMVDLEDRFIDLAFGQGGIEGITRHEVKQYVRYIADRRLNQLGYVSLYRVDKNPLPWLDEILNGVEHVNFFENRVTEYSRASTEGTWEDAWGIHDD